MKNVFSVSVIFIRNALWRILLRAFFIWPFVTRLLLNNTLFIKQQQLFTSVVKPSFISHSNARGSLDNNYFSELWELPPNFRFTLVVAYLGKDTSTTPVGCNRILLKPKGSSSKLTGISFSDRNQTFPDWKRQR